MAAGNVHDGTLEQSRRGKPNATSRLREKDKIGNFRLVGSPAGLQMHQLVRDGGGNLVAKLLPEQSDSESRIKPTDFPFQLQLPEYVLESHDSETFVGVASRAAAAQSGFPHEVPHVQQQTPLQQSHDQQEHLDTGRHISPEIHTAMRSTGSYSQQETQVAGTFASAVRRGREYQGDPARMGGHQRKY